MAKKNGHKLKNVFLMSLTLILFFSFFTIAEIIISESSNNKFSEENSDYPSTRNGTYNSLFTKEDISKLKNKTYEELVKENLDKKKVSNKYGQIYSNTSWVDEKTTIILPNYISVDSYSKDAGKEYDFEVKFYTGNDRVEYGVYKKTGYKIDKETVKQTGQFLGNYLSYDGYVTIKTNSFSTVILAMPDLCLPTGVTHEINLSEYFSIKTSVPYDEPHLYAKDPLHIGESGYYDILSAGWATINNLTAGECYNAYLYYAYGVYDWITIETADTLSQSCYFDSTAPNSGDGFRVYFCNEGNCGDKTFGATFALNISDDCDYNYSEGGGGASGSLLAGLVNYYPLNDSSATAKDYLGNNTGTLTGSTANMYGVAGKITEGFTFDGTDDTIKDIYNPDGTDGFSFCAWANTSTGGDIFLGGDDSSWRVGMLNNGSIEGYIHNAAGTRKTVYGGIFPTNGTFKHICLTYNGSYVQIYEDGVAKGMTAQTGNIKTDTTFWSVIGAGYGYSNPALEWNGHIDEVYIYERGINSTEVGELYNNGDGYDFFQGGGGSSGVPPTYNGTLPDVAMDGYDTHTVNLDAYFQNWSEMYSISDDPINNYTYYIATGYSTLNADYYETLVFANGTLQIDSYGRNYTFDITAMACNYDQFGDCVNDTFEVVITNTNPQGVVEHAVPPYDYEYDLGYTNAGSETFTYNYRYQYYQAIKFVFPDSNYTGNLNSTFPFLYGAAYNQTRYNLSSQQYTNVTFHNVTIDCFLVNNTNYNFLMDINITLECGLTDVSITLSAYNNYNQTWNITAYNSVNSTWDFFNLISGNGMLFAGQTLGLWEGVNLTNKSLIFGNFTDDFDDFYDDTLSDKAKNWTMLITILLIIIGFYSIFLPLRVPFGIITNLVVIASILALFFFANIGYLTASRAFQFAVVAAAYFIIKYLLNRSK